MVNLKDFFNVGLLLNLVLLYAGYEVLVFSMAAALLGWIPSVLAALAVTVAIYLFYSLVIMRLMASLATRMKQEKEEVIKSVTSALVDNLTTMLAARLDAQDDAIASIKKAFDADVAALGHKTGQMLTDATAAFDKTLSVCQRVISAEEKKLWSTHVDGHRHITAAHKQTVDTMAQETVQLKKQLALRDQDAANGWGVMSCLQDQLRDRDITIEAHAATIKDLTAEQARHREHSAYTEQQLLSMGYQIESLKDTNSKQASTISAQAATIDSQAIKLKSKSILIKSQAAIIQSLKDELSAAAGATDTKAAAASPSAAAVVDSSGKSSDLASQLAAGAFRFSASGAPAFATRTPGSSESGARPPIAALRRSSSAAAAKLSVSASVQTLTVAAAEATTQTASVKLTSTATQVATLFSTVGTDPVTSLELGLSANASTQATPLTVAAAEAATQTASAKLTSTGTQVAALFSTVGTDPIGSLELGLSANVSTQATPLSLRSLVASAKASKQTAAAAGSTAAAAAAGGSRASSANVFMQLARERISSQVLFSIVSSSAAGSMQRDNPTLPQESSASASGAVAAAVVTDIEESEDKKAEEADAAAAGADAEAAAKAVEAVEAKPSIASLAVQGLRSHAIDVEVELSSPRSHPINVELTSHPIQVEEECECSSPRSFPIEVEEEESEEYGPKSHYIEVSDSEDDASEDGCEE